MAFIAQVVIGRLAQNLDDQCKTEHISSVSRLVTKAVKEHLYLEVEPQSVFKQIVNSTKPTSVTPENTEEIAVESTKTVTTLARSHPNFPAIRSAARSWETRSPRFLEWHLLCNVLNQNITDPLLT